MQSKQFYLNIYFYSCTHIDLICKSNKVEKVFNKVVECGRMWDKFVYLHPIRIVKK